MIGPQIIPLNMIGPQIFPLNHKSFPLNMIGPQIIPLNMIGPQIIPRTGFRPTRNVHMSFVPDEEVGL